jgi:DNA-binding YbaB/EbfC family protein
MSDAKVPDLSSLMNMAQQLQQDATRIQEELEKKTCEASSGGGMVTATVNGKYELVALVVEPNVIDPADPVMLQDLIIAAVNQAMVKMRELAKDEMSKLTGGLNIPGMPNLF